MVQGYVGYSGIVIERPGLQPLTAPSMMPLLK